MMTEDFAKGIVFPRGGKMPECYNKNFTGQAYLQMLVTNKEFNCPIGNVTFEPGCRNSWHKHPGGQLLLVTGGHGWYQEEGKAARKLQAGDIVEIHPNVKHWHGATRDSWFSHLSVETNVQLGAAEWLEPVTDEEYNGLK